MNINDAVELLNYEAKLDLDYADDLEHLLPLLERYDGKVVDRRIGENVCAQFEPACHLGVGREGDSFAIWHSAKEPHITINGQIYYVSNRSNNIKNSDVMENRRLIFEEAAKLITGHIKRLRCAASAIQELDIDMLTDEYKVIITLIGLYCERVPYEIRKRLNMDFHASFPIYRKGRLGS